MYQLRKSLELLFSSPLFEPSRESQIDCWRLPPHRIRHTCKSISVLHLIRISHSQILGAMASRMAINPPQGLPKIFFSSSPFTLSFFPIPHFHQPCTKAHLILQTLPPQLQNPSYPHFPQTPHSNLRDSLPTPQ